MLTRTERAFLDKRINFLFSFLYFSKCSVASVYYFYHYVVFQLLSHVRLFATPRAAACQALLSSTISWSLLRFMSIELAIYLTISSFAAPFSFYLQSFPELGSFLMSWLFASGGQSVRASASATVLL